VHNFEEWRRLNTTHLRESLLRLLFDAGQQAILKEFDHCDVSQELKGIVGRMTKLCWLEIGREGATKPCDPKEIMKQLESVE
jgi:hypothetical protein